MTCNLSSTHEIGSVQRVFVTKSQIPRIIYADILKVGIFKAYSWDITFSLSKHYEYGW